MKQKASINSHTILQRNPDQLFTMVDQEVVMLNIKHQEYLNLNQHASHIWQQLETPHSFGELIDLLCSIYQVKKEDCIRDTLEFITEFVDKDIIQIIHEKPS